MGNYKNKNEKLNTRQAKQVRGIVNKTLNKTFELKRKFDEQTEATLTTAGLGLGPLQNHLTQIAQGTLYNQRAGHQIRAKGIHWKGTAHLNSPTAPVLLRLVVCKLKNAAKLSEWNLGTGVFENNSGDQSTSASVIDISRPFNLDNYDILWDKRIHFGLSSDDAARVKTWNKFIKFKYGLPVHYNSSTDGDVSKNPISVWAIAREAPNDSGVVGETVEMTWSARLFYVDT